MKLFLYIILTALLVSNKVFAFDQANQSLSSTELSAITHINGQDDGSVLLKGCEGNVVHSIGASNSLNFKEVAAQECCKICTKGQACGNSCKSWEKTCHQPVGCACQGGGK